MNRRMLRKMFGKHVLLSPPVQSLFPDGTIEDRASWLWIVSGRPKNALPLQLMSCGHVSTIPFTEIKNYQDEDGCIRLRCRVWITATDVALKPLDWRPTPAMAASGRLH